MSTGSNNGAEIANAIKHAIVNDRIEIFFVAIKLIIILNRKKSSINI